MLEVLQNKGNLNELHILESLQESGLVISNLKESSTLDATRLAMQFGADIIYQAPLSLERFTGRSDFLIKVTGASILGDYHYEIWDTKLALSVKPSFPIQLCCYAEMLEKYSRNKA